jgi:hypothetical protein
VQSRLGLLGFEFSPCSITTSYFICFHLNQCFQYQEHSVIQIWRLHCIVLVTTIGQNIVGSAGTLGAPWQPGTRSGRSRGKRKMKLKDFMPGEGGRARTMSTIVYVLMSSATLLSLVFYQQNFQFPMCSYVSGKSAFRKKKVKVQWRRCAPRTHIF